MPKFEKHIFICTNQRPQGHAKGSCNPDGTGELHQLFKAGLAKRGLNGCVRANKSGCLDQCEHGPTVVVYPEATWYGGVTAADVDEILDAHIAGDHPVQRLIIPDSCLNAESCPHKPRR
jgi:(2Fe-2S) ferredoxin